MTCLYKDTALLIGDWKTQMFITHDKCLMLSISINKNLSGVIKTVDWETLHRENSYDVWMQGIVKECYLDRAMRVSMPWYDICSSDSHCPPEETFNAAISMICGVWYVIFMLLQVYALLALWTLLTHTFYTFSLINLLQYIYMI